MQNCTTILGIIDMRQRGISYDDCRNRYHIGCSTISLIMSRFNSCGKDLDTLRQMPADEVEQLFFPPENLRRKDDAVMPDYQMVYDRLTAPGSKANLFYLWLKYKKECPSGYQYTQYCLYFKRFVEKNYGSKAVSIFYIVINILFLALVFYKMWRQQKALAEEEETEELA